MFALDSHAPKPAVLVSSLFWQRSVAWRSDSSIQNSDVYLQYNSTIMPACRPSAYGLSAFRTPPRNVQCIGAKRGIYIYQPAVQVPIPVVTCCQRYGRRKGNESRTKETSRIERPFSADMTRVDHRARPSWSGRPCVAQ